MSEGTERQNMNKFDSKQCKYSNSSYKIMPGLFWDDTEQTTNRSWDQKFHWVKGQPGLIIGGFVKLTSLKINGNKIVTT